jgi:D-serine deaminase-like pyridoxal phosphate-dependent protein
VDCPEPGLALLDAGSKVLSGDKSADGTHAADFARREIRVMRCSEEHGWATGADVERLRVGDRLRLVQNHVCPVINLTDDLTVMQDHAVAGEWRVAARGKSR